MGPNGPWSKLIFLVGTTYQGWMGFQFTFVQNGVLVTTQDCTMLSEWYLQTELID